MEETNQKKFYTGQLVAFDGYEDVYEVVNFTSNTEYNLYNLKLKNLRTRNLGDHSSTNCHVLSFLEIMLYRISQSLAADTKTTKL